MKVTSGCLIKALAIYSLGVISLITFAVLSSEETTVHEKAIIKMALGLILFWIILGGSLMYRYRDAIASAVRRVPLNWRVKFVLFATLLALLEEAVTVSMTNLAPLLGSEIGQAFITASANYVHTVLFHSVIVFVPMFMVWAFLLGRYDFAPQAVFLLFGLTGSLAEMSMQPTNILGGFWFFVYGLMVFLPAYSLPTAAERWAIPPRRWHFALAVFLPLISPIMLLPVFPLLRYLYDVMDPVFFVESAFK